MFSFRFLSDIVRPFRATKEPIEDDSDDDMVGVSKMPGFRSYDIANASFRQRTNQYLWQIPSSMQIYQTAQKKTPTCLCQPSLACPASLFLPSPSTSITRQALRHHHTPRLCVTIWVLYLPRPHHSLLKISCNAVSSPSRVIKRIRFRREDSAKNSKDIAVARRICLLKTHLATWSPTGHGLYPLLLAPIPPRIQTSPRRWHTRLNSTFQSSWRINAA